MTARQPDRQFRTSIFTLSRVAKET
jgi:hypothetical protein